MKNYFNKKIITYLLLLIVLSMIFTTGFSYSSNTDTKKIIYLTFDDGPSKKVTPDVLDILDKYKIKATFFVVGEQFKGNEDVLKRISNDGHSLGIHSYTHNFSKLYNKCNVVNKEFFMNEMIKCQEELKEITGVDSKILRFPGGSHKRLSEDLLLEFKKHDWKVYDWTHSSEDGVNLKASPDTLFRKSLKKIPSPKESPGVILLMHCNASNKNSVLALPQIIEHYQKEGYEFKVITADTPEYHCD